MSARLLIGGREVEPSGSLAVLDPSTGRELARVAEAGPEEVDLAVAAAREALAGPWG